MVTTTFATTTTKTMTTTMDADAVTMGWNVRFVCFADIDNDVGGGGDAAYVHTCQYTYICVYMMAYNAYIYIL